MSVTSQLPPAPKQQVLPAGQLKQVGDSRFVSMGPWFINSMLGYSSVRYLPAKQGVQSDIEVNAAAKFCLHRLMVLADESDFSGQLKPRGHSVQSETLSAPENSNDDVFIVIFPLGQGLQNA